MKKNDLRKACLNKYGKEFIKLYDLLSNGVAVGDFAETVNILHKINVVKEEQRCGGSSPDIITGNKTVTVTIDYPSYCEEFKSF